MANVSRINGFRPVSHKNGSPYNGQGNWYFIPSTDGTAVYPGDAVKLAGSSSADGYSTVQLAAAGDAIVGHVIGFAVNPLNLNIDGSYRAASTNRYAIVEDSPDVVWEVQTSNGTLAVTDVGLNINHAVGTPSTTTGTSGATIDVGTKATTATLTYKVWNFSTRVDNEIGSAAAKVWVVINNHQFGSSTGTAGV